MDRGRFHGSERLIIATVRDGRFGLLVVLIQLDKVTRGENLDSVGFENR